MAAIDRYSLIIRNDSLATGEIDGEIVALDIEHGECFGLDPIAADIWRRAAQPISVGDLAAALVEEYEVDIERCMADLEPFLAELEDCGMIQVIADG